MIEILACMTVVLAVSRKIMYLNSIDNFVLSENSHSPEAISPSCPVYSEWWEDYRVKVITYNEKKYISVFRNVILPSFWPYKDK